MAAVRRRRTKPDGYKRTHPEHALVYLARDRAKRSGVPCTITVEDVIIPKKCPVLDIVLKDTRKRDSQGDHKASPNSPSIDRIIPSKGYVPGNIRVISHRANRMRGDCTVQEIEKLYLYLMMEGAK